MLRHYDTPCTTRRKSASRERRYARKYNVKKKFTNCMLLRQVAENETGAKNMRLDIVNDTRAEDTQLIVEDRR
jgi:hypothetical protein